MGMYTELHFNSELRKDVPDDVVAILRHMTGQAPKPAVLPDHPLFADDTRWSIMLESDSYYFDADTISTMRFDEVSNQWVLCIRCNFKNYCDEAAKFIDWVSPYLDKFPGDFLGFYRYEEVQIPTLIYHKDFVR
jgi:hypothetical protein